MTLHVIKLVVGLESLEEFYDFQSRSAFDYDGVPANACYTRFKPKQADEILQGGGSLYRVIKHRIVCRQKILGFETVETADRGSQCAIIVENRIIQTMKKPKRPFQGWRYLKPSDAPKDRGIYLGEDTALEDIPEDMEDALRASGLI